MTDKKPFDKEQSIKIPFSELVELINQKCDYKFAIIDNEVDEELMERCVEEINGRFPREDGLAKYIAVWALETHAIATSPILREIFYHAYTSDTMFEKLLDRHVLLLARFDVRLPPEKDARIRVTLLGGAMRGYIASFAFAKPFDESAFRSELLAMVMNALGASPKTQAAIWRTLENRDGEWKEIAAVLLR